MVEMLAIVPHTTQLVTRSRTFVYGPVEGGAKWAYAEVRSGGHVLIGTVPNHGEGRLRAHLKSLVDGRAQRRARRARRNRWIRDERFNRMVTAIVRGMSNRLVSIGELHGILACLSRREQIEWVRFHMPVTERLEWLRQFKLIQ